MGICGDVGRSTGAPSAPQPTPLLPALMRLCRPKQFTKNVLVLAAPGAAGVLTHRLPLERTLAAFGLFCMVAAGTYALNDTIDVEADRAHPTKRFRPIASGAVGTRFGFAFAGVMLAGGAALAALVTWRLSVVLAVYALLQLAYSFRLKHMPIYDLAAVAAGFVLRAIAGGVAAHVNISQWFLLVATFGSLLMVTGKRLAEHIDLGEGRGAHRAILDAYTTTFLRTVLAIAAGGGIVCYCLWAFDLQTALLHHADPIYYQLSTVPIMLALLRYTYLVEGGRGAKPEDLVIGDRSLQVLGVAWAVLFALGVYAS